MNWTIRNGTVLGTERLKHTDLFVEGGMLSDRGNGGREIDAAGLLVLPREGKDRGGMGTHLRTPVRSNLCATVARGARDTQEEHRTHVWHPPRAALRWATRTTEPDGSDRRRQEAAR